MASLENFHFLTTRRKWCKFMLEDLKERNQPTHFDSLVHQLGTVLTPDQVHVLWNEFMVEPKVTVVDASAHTVQYANALRESVYDYSSLHAYIYSRRLGEGSKWTDLQETYPTVLQDLRLLIHNGDIDVLDAANFVPGNTPDIKIENAVVFARHRELDRLHAPGWMREMWGHWCETEQKEKLTDQEREERVIAWCLDRGETTKQRVAEQATLVRQQRQEIWVRHQRQLAFKRRVKEQATAALRQSKMIQRAPAMKYEAKSFTNHHLVGVPGFEFITNPNLMLPMAITHMSKRSDKRKKTNRKQITQAEEEPEGGVTYARQRLQ